MQWGVVRCPTSISDFFEKCTYGRQKLRHVIQVTEPTHVVCEWPEFQGLTQGARGDGLGDIGKLHFQIGGVASVAGEAGVSFSVAPVGRWKGNLKKETVIYRLRNSLSIKEDRRVSLDYPKSHAWDAIGIGFWKVGRF